MDNNFLIRIEWRRGVCVIPTVSDFAMPPPPAARRLAAPHAEQSSATASKASESQPGPPRPAGVWVPPVAMPLYGYGFMGPLRWSLFYSVTLATGH